MNTTVRRARGVMMAAVLLLPGCLCNSRPGEGEKIGNIVRVSRVGILCDTWEGQIIRGGMSGGSGSFGTQPFDFTVQSDSVARVLQAYMREQREVLIRYRTKGVYGACSSDSEGHFLVSVEPIAK